MLVSVTGLTGQLDQLTIDVGKAIALADNAHAITRPKYVVHAYCQANVLNYLVATSEIGGTFMIIRPAIFYGSLCWNIFRSGCPPKPQWFVWKNPLA